LIQIGNPATWVFAAALGLLVLSHPARAQQLSVTPSKPSGVYARGEKIAWDVKVIGEGADKVTSARYQIRKGGGVSIAEGTLDLSAAAGGTGRIETTQTEPLAYLAEVKATGADGKEIRALGGAAVDPQTVRPSIPRPADFDAFWEKNLRELAAVPLNPLVESGDGGREGVEYAKVTLDNVGGAKVRAQLARPRAGAKLPALVIVQWAGVYGLNKNWVTDRAAEGWLVLNVMPHDLPIDETPEFYKKAGETTLREYGSIGNHSRETSYMRKMLLGDVQATKYLMSRPDWDGKTLVVSGTSMGGYQSIALAALQPKVTAALANVPAGCDQAAKVAGRAIPWPYWVDRNVKGNEAAIVEASRYYDDVNFAACIRVPVLVSLGLIDTTCPPTGILAMANALKGPKEVVILPLSDHQGRNNTQRPYYERVGVWMRDLKDGKPAPAK